MSPKKEAQKSAKSTTAIGKKFKGFTDEERIAMKERIQELKAAARRGPRAEGVDGARRGRDRRARHESGNLRLQGAGGGAAQVIDDPAGRVLYSAEPDRTGVHLPQSVVDFLDAHLGRRQHVPHVHPAP